MIILVLFVEVPIELLDLVEHLLHPRDRREEVVEAEVYFVVFEDLPEGRARHGDDAGLVQQAVAVEEVGLHALLVRHLNGFLRNFDFGESAHRGLDVSAPDV